MSNTVAVVGRLEGLNFGNGHLELVANHFLLSLEPGDAKLIVARCLCKLII